MWASFESIQQAADLRVGRAHAGRQQRVGRAHDEPPPPTEAQQQMAAGKLAAVHVLNASMLGALALLFIFSASSTILSCFS